jgi:hypothetical protein
MKNSAGAFTAISLLIAALLPASATAADWPAVKGSEPPACTTPGRLMAMVKSRNPGLDARFDTIAVDYMRAGTDMGLRWDYAFFIMLVETSDLTFKKGVRGGAVKAEQHNVGGIGTMGGNEPGESFASVADGVRAHLEHLSTYAGLTVDNAVSERTRKFQTWERFKEIQASLNGRQASFADVIGNWAPKSKAYLDGVDKAAKTFASDYCRKADPRPELVSAARGGTAAAQATAVQPQQVAAVVEKPSGQVLAKQAVDAGKADANNIRTNLGAGLAKAKSQPPEVRIINEQQPQRAETETVQTASASAGAAAAAKAQAPAVTGPGKCRVWTASYGRDKALIIKATTNGIVNYTVLDVNAGQETREADAYIAAYAKGGKVEAQFANQAEALDKAFGLCPEG